jgi:hypothetical protein
VLQRFNKARHRQGSAFSKFVYLFIFRGDQYVLQVSMLFISNNWFFCKNVYRSRYVLTIYNELEIDDNINQALSNKSQIFKQEKQKTYKGNSFGAFN